MKIILLLLYAIIMLISITFQIDTIYFLLLFAVAPIVIYLFVKKIFPKEEQ
ncbi:MAG: hypothetical protein K8R39_06210 [Arcobacteraceae bacterium]|nr:hypothetical protein [Arcobacteraceae bacterium]